MATPKKPREQMAVPKLGSVTPPKMRRGGRGVQIPEAVLDAWVEALANSNGEPIADESVTFDSRGKASGMATRIRNGLVERGDAEEGAITSRVYSIKPEDAEKRADDQAGPFTFALVLGASEAGEAGDAGSE